MDLGKTLVPLAGVIALVWTSSALGWGGAGHQIIAESSAILTESSFWSANEENLGVLANVPDRVWRSGKSGSVEAQTHFFEPDAYTSDPAQHSQFPRRWEDATATHSEPSVIAHGTAVWRFQQLLRASESAVRAGDPTRILQMAGVMAHYLGDLAQPLHVTINYDGELTGQNGIHKYFETTNLASRDYRNIKAEVTERARLRLQDRDFVSYFRTDPETLIFRLVDLSYSRLSDILDADETLGRNRAGGERQYELALTYMADATAILAMMLNRISSINPKGLPLQTLKVPAPAWVVPNYSKMNARQRKLQNSGFFSAPQATQRPGCG